jgi:hypothetical protein
MRVNLFFMDNTHTEVPKFPALKDRRFGGWRRDGRPLARSRPTVARDVEQLELFPGSHIGELVPGIIAE